MQDTSTIRNYDLMYIEFRAADSVGAEHRLRLCPAKNKTLEDNIWPPIYCIYKSSTIYTELER